MDPKSMPAFPASYYTDDGEFAKRDGMTLRDYFAAKVMQSAITGAVLPGLADDLMPQETVIALQQVSKAAYRVADAMLAAR
ncbi:hypothetical protein J2W88_003954 [Acidovorax delafieldii]|uniref:Uncharacterized protein n=1 Tax=Acidovorax delafieldii TaxID=47920 RepID=A0AAJ2BYV5_ACIDE|nr:hypothetical protein [Acidovorax delafieldii]MDR6768650.1 hypothetical protein [Acidovorax delafieldii]MDR6837365.1 hypothetical protein [Acidovorax delafieldii]MDR7366856.1 hypothetical protein [Acidovorax delafieldii]